MIRIIILLILLSACNSVRRNVVRSTVETNETKSAMIDSISSSKTITNEAKQEQRDKTDYEIETSQNDFPTNADTSLEIVKIAKSLPKGSKIKVTHDRGNVVSETKIIQKDTTAKHVDTTHVRTEEKKTVEVHKESKRVPWLAILIVCGGIIVIGGLIAYKKLI